MRFYLGRRIGNGKWYAGVGVNREFQKPKHNNFNRGFKIGLWIAAAVLAFQAGPILLVLGIGYLAALLMPRRNVGIGSIRY
jgi:phosphate/sulfate permease